MADLYVGNLQWETTEEDLKKHFSAYGDVHSVKVIMDPETNRSKGFGFVSMENAEDAIKNLDGSELRGRTIRVNTARERASSKPQDKRFRPSRTFA